MCSVFLLSRMPAADGLFNCANSLQEGCQIQTILMLTSSDCDADTFAQGKKYRRSDTCAVRTARAGHADY